MYNVPIDVICYVKELYARHTTWHDIVLNTKDQYPNLELTERRIKQIYEKNKSEFKEAREEYKKLIESEFKDDREALFGTTLKAEQALASSYLEEIERMKEGLSMLDPVEDTKEYTALLSAIHKAQQSLEKIANTDRFRRLEENKQRLEQVKELKESLPSGERSGEEPLQINIIGHE